MSTGLGVQVKEVQVRNRNDRESYTIQLTDPRMRPFKFEDVNTNLSNCFLYIESSSYIFLSKHNHRYKDETNRPEPSETLVKN